MCPVSQVRASGTSVVLRAHRQHPILCSTRSPAIFAHVHEKRPSLLNLFLPFHSGIDLFKFSGKRRERVLRSAFSRSISPGTPIFANRFREAEFRYQRKALRTLSSNGRSAWFQGWIPNFLRSKKQCARSACQQCCRFESTVLACLSERCSIEHRAPEEPPLLRPGDDALLERRTTGAGPAKPAPVRPQVAAVPPCRRDQTPAAAASSPWSPQRFGPDSACRPSRPSARCTACRPL
jgi:hypothetical protein